MNTRFVFLVAVLLLAGCASSAEREADRDKLNKLAETHVLLGSSYFQRGQLDVAKQELDKALKLIPDHSQANNIMAVLQWRLKKYDEADRLFRKALDKDASNSSAHHNYGAFLCDRGKLDAGVRHFDAAAVDALYPYTAEVNLNAGVCLMKKPAPAAAEKYFREALRINPKLPGALYQMARLSADSGQRLSARGFIERALGNKNAEASYALRLRSKFPTSPEAGQLHAASAPKKK